MKIPSDGMKIPSDETELKWATTTKGTLNFFLPLFKIDNSLDGIDNAFTWIMPIFASTKR